MNYDPNTTVWQLGDIVIHEADTKKPDMLMMVTTRWNDELDHYETLYLYGGQERKAFLNVGSVLHDPARFGIVVPSYQEIMDRLIKSLRGGVISADGAGLYRLAWDRLSRERVPD